MEQPSYLTDRLQGQLKYLSANSAKCKRRYLFLKTIEIGLAASVSFVASFAANEDGRCFAIAASAIGVVIVVFSGLRQIFRFQETWISQRKTAEALKREKYFYENKVNPYDKEDALKVLVERVEAILATESGEWTSNQSSTDGK